MLLNQILRCYAFSENAWKLMQNPIPLISYLPTSIPFQKSIILEIHLQALCAFNATWDRTFHLPGGSTFEVYCAYRKREKKRRTGSDAPGDATQRSISGLRRHSVSERAPGASGCVRDSSAYYT